MTAAQERNDEPLTFEKVWEMLRESGREADRRLAESSREADRRKAEADQRLAEIDRRMAESVREADRRMAETDKIIGKLGNRFGEMVEYLVLPNLVAKFKDLGYVFEDVGPNREINDLAHGISCEVDAYLENRDCVMAVETKVKPSQRDVNDHIKRMEKLRAIANYRKDTRKYYGAMAGVMMSEEIKSYLLDRGLFAIEPSGETFTIIKPADPREW